MSANLKLSAVNHLDQLLQLSPNLLAQQAPLEPVEWPAICDAQLKLSLLRLDKIDPLLSGNKLFKLYYYLQDYQRSGANVPIASFGGAYSNHLHTLAALGQQLSIPTVGVVRADNGEASPTLDDLRSYGMNIHEVSRSDYRQRHNSDWRAGLTNTLGSVYWVPEGGGGQHGVKGCIALGQHLATTLADVVTVACGTAATLAGIIAGLNDHKSSSHVMGFSSLKGSERWMVNDVEDKLAEQGLSSRLTSWSLNSNFQCGGFGQYPDYLSNFVGEFEYRTRVLLDPVYTAKMLYGIDQLAKVGFWPKGTHIVAVHTGGLQGRRGHSLANAG